MTSTTTYPPAHDPSRVLLDQNEWANRLLIEACAGLGDAGLDRPFEMGLGSLRPTVTHILGAMKAWTDTLARRPRGSRLETGNPLGVDDWRTLVGPISDDLRAAAFMGPMDEILPTERAGQSYSFARSHVIVHVTTHGMHHRAQCLNMLRHLGVADLPASSVMQWSIAQG